MNLVCGFVEPQTFSLSRKRAASVAMECETETTMEVENVNLPRTARERMLIAEMEQCVEMGESIHSGNRGVGAFLAWTRRSWYQHEVFCRKTHGKKEAIATSCCSTHFEAKEQVEALKWQMQRVFAEAAEEGRKREEASAATQETPREETAMEIDQARLLPVLDAFMLGLQGTMSSLNG